METKIRLSTHPLVLAWLGTPLITFVDRPLTFRTRKALALLVYLTTEAGVHTREKLTTLFWPESDATRGRGMLRTSLAYLRETLDAIDMPYLIVEPQTLSFDFNSHFELDLHLLQAGLDVLQRQPAPAERERLISQLQMVVNRYRGDFLEGFSLADAPAFDDWASLQREIWHSRMNLIFDALSQWQFEAGDLPAALETARRWRAHDLYGESAPQRLMQLHFANGNRADALQVYDDYAKMLAAEFGGKPSPAIKTLAARIRSKSPARPEREQAPLPAPTTELAFVGRVDEFKRLITAYQAACQGRTQVVILEGEAGIGKTRLAAEFLRWVTAQGADVLAGRAFETGGELPYQPVAHLLRHRLDQEQELTDLLSPIWLAELSRLLPEVRERYPDLSQPNANDPAAQSRLLESITRLGKALAERAPLVLLIDDIQWADLPSLDALQYALSQWAEYKTTILLLLCTRNNSASPTNNLRQWVTSLKAKIAVTHMTLAPLTVEETLALVASLEGAPTCAGPDVAHQVVAAPTQAANAAQPSAFQAFAQALFDETGGQPLYLVETIKSLLEQKVLIPYPAEGGSPGVRWKTLAGETTGQFPLPRIIPNSVREAILDRLSRLTPAAAALLSAAAVLGQAATFSQITAVSGIEEMAALDALEELVAKRLLVASSQATDSYLVAHDKIRDVVYNESSAVRRKVLHRRAVAALQGGDPARVAYHAQAAEMDLETFQANVGAGDAELHLFAVSEAIAHYESARKMIVAGQMPHVELDQLRHLYLNLGRALELNAQFEQAEVIYEELKTIAQQRAAPTLTLVALTAQVSLWSMASQSYNPVQGEALAQEALRLARQLSDPVAETKILSGIMNFHLLANRWPEALACGEQALALARDLNLQEQTAYILNDLVKCHLISGSLERADQAAREASELWRTLKNLPMLADSLAGAAIIARWTGEYDQALALSAEAHQISQSIANVWGQSYSQIITGTILWEQGRAEEAIAVMEECLRLAEQANSLLPQILTRADLGATYVSLSDMQRGFEQMHLALKLADTRLPMFRPYVIGLLARQHLLHNQLGEAEALIEQAKTESNSEHRSFLFQWVRLAEAELALRQGNFAHVLAVTDAILAAIRQSGMRSVIPRVLFVRGQCLVHMGQLEAARATLLEAHAEAERIGTRWRLMQILAARARIERDPMQAERLLQQSEALKADLISRLPADPHATLEDQESAEEFHPSSVLPKPSPAVHDWGDMPAIAQFHGREQELAMVSGWLQEGLRIVAVLGIGGVGKSALAAQTVRQVADRFDVVIWSSLLNAPPLSEILRHWLQTLSRQAITTLGTSLDDQIRQLLTLLRQQHCLLILDNMESVLHSAAQADPSTGKLRPGYEGYEQLLHSLSSEAHCSTLLLTSRELPAVLSRWQEQPAAVRVLPLTGLPVQAGQALLQAQGLVPSERTASALVQQYSGNPLALQIVSRTILDLYDGDIDAFTQEGFPIFDDIRTVLDQQFARLSALERELLIWLAVEREAVTAPALRINLVDKGTQRSFLEALRSLQQRSLLEKSSRGFTLQNVVIEYITEHLIETICAELIANDDKVTRWQGDKVNEEHPLTLSPLHPVTLSLFNRHALLKAQSKEYVRASQRRLILQPIGERLLARFGRGGLQSVFYEYLQSLRQQSGAQYAPGYAAGNLLNLALHFGVDLSSADFSKLAIWQADLRGAYVPGLNFAGADLTGSVFTQVFGALYAVQFDPQNELVVAEMNDGYLSLRNVATDSVLHEFTLQAPQIHALLLSPDLRLAALASLIVIHLVDLTNGEILHTLAGHDSHIWKYRFDDQGNLLATGDAGGRVCVWNCATGELLHTLLGADTGVTAVAFSPNSQLLASATVDGTVFLWELTSGALLQTLRGHNEEVGALAFALDGTVLVTGSNDTTVGLWSVVDGRLLHRLIGHTLPVRDLATTASGQLLASGGGNSFVYVWDMSSGRALHILSSHASVLDRLSISPDGRTVVTLDLNDVISLWDIQRGLRVDTYPIYRNVIWALAFDPAGERMVTGGADSAIYLWDVRSGQPAHLESRLTGAQHRAMAIAFHTDGKTVASADGNEIQLWDVQAGRLLRTLHGHTGAISRLAFHPAGHQLASSGERTIRLWSIERGQQVRQLRGHTSVVTCCRFSPPVEAALSTPIYLLASGSLDQTVLVWDAETGKLLHTLRGHTNAVTECVFSPDGRCLFSASYDQTMRVWCVQTGQLSATWPTPGTVYFALAMHPGGKIIAAAGDDPVIRLVAVESGRIVGELHGHSRNISSLHFSPNGEWLASTSWDETIKLWAVTESAGEWRGVCLQTVKSPAPYADMNITGVTGISEVQKAALKALGAYEQSDAGKMIENAIPARTAGMEAP